MTKLFNILILVALALSIVLWFIPVLDHYWLSDAALDLLDANGWGAVLPFSKLLYWPLLVFWVVVSIGMLKRIKIFRAIYFYGLIFMCVVNFGWGFLIFTSLEAGINNIITLMDGAILTMAYLTSVSNEFELSPNNKLQPTAESGG